jgi:hypothetical protein
MRGPSVKSSFKKIKKFALLPCPSTNEMQFLFRGTCRVKIGPISAPSHWITPHIGWARTPQNTWFSNRNCHFIHKKMFIHFSFVRYPTPLEVHFEKGAPCAVETKIFVLGKIFVKFSRTLKNAAVKFITKRLNLSTICEIKGSWHSCFCQWFSQKYLFSPMNVAKIFVFPKVFVKAFVRQELMLAAV